MPENTEFREHLQTYIEMYLSPGLKKAAEAGTTPAMATFALMELIRLFLEQSHPNDALEQFEILTCGFAEDWRQGNETHH